MSCFVYLLLGPKTWLLHHCSALQEVVDLALASLFSAPRGRGPGSCITVQYTERSWLIRCITG